MTVRVLLADDQQLLREALRVFLERDRTIKIVAETGDGLDVVELARATDPDVVCMDIDMPGMDGIEATQRLIDACPNIKVIGLSTSIEGRHVLDMLDAGASAYVAKAAACEELPRAIKSVLAGRKYYCTEAAAVFINALLGPGDKQERNDTTALSPREQQVLRLLAEGRSSTHISNLLNISGSTVDVYRRNIMRKLGLHSDDELSQRDSRCGLPSD
jgi:two-component system NarL family response regulator